MARMSGRTRAINALVEVQGALEVIQPVQPLPGELLLAPPEVAVGRGAAIDRPAGGEGAGDGQRAAGGGWRRGGRPPAAGRTPRPPPARYGWLRQSQYRRSSK